MMKKRTYTILAAALLTAGALLSTACSNEDEAVSDNSTAQTVTFTATLAPKGGASRDQSRAGSNFGEAQPALAEGKGSDGAQTRAIIPGTDADGKETLTTTWAVDEKIAIYYEYGSSSHSLGYATVQTVNADGSATVSGTFNSKQMPKDGGAAKFMYPLYLMDQSGNVKYDATPGGLIDGMRLVKQYGNLTGNNSISLGASTEYRGGCDLAIGYGTMSVSGSEATISGSVSMENEVCICKFRFALDEGTGMGTSGGSEHTFSPVIINDGDGHTYTIVSDRPDDMVGGMTRKFKSTDDIYVALLPISGKTVTFSYTETTSSGEVIYSCNKTNVTLEKGKFYRNLGTITLVKQ